MKRLEIENEIVTTLSYLSKIQQIKLLTFVKSLIVPKKKDKDGLLNLVGTIDKEDLEIMRKVIEEECENIDRDGW
ncbi:MAG: hypothetical protein IIA88_05895 [Bacteroidetes bacterium]|nr:hypothetical protein [Bacteroidota bacterium]